MPVINIKNILQSYQQTLSLPANLKFPLSVKNCLQSVLGITNPTIGIGCAWGLLNTSDYDYVSNCLSNYGSFTDTQLQNLIDCISNCRVGATVYSTEKGPIQWYDCCGQIYNDTVLPNVPYVISGCIRNYSVLPLVIGSQPSITLSAVTYGGVNCDCPPPSPTPTPTVTPTFGYTPTPTPTPTLTRTPTPTASNTPTPTRSQKPLIPITPLPIPPTPSFNPTPTPTASPNIPSVGCGTQVGFTTSQSVTGPKTYIYKYNLGNQIGNVKLNIDFKTCNDRAIVIYDGQTVIDTGCQGQYYESCYSDPQCNTGELLAPWNNPYIIPSTVTDVNNGNVSPGNIQENQNSGECNNKISFYKSGASPTFAYLIVKSPSPHNLNYNGTYICDKTVWEGGLSCPDGDTFNFLGPNSLKLLTTQQQYNCLTGDTLTPMTIPVNTILTILPSWGYPPGSGSLGDVKHTVWVEGASAVSNPTGVYAPANGSPNWVVTPNPQTVYDIVIPNPTLPPTTFNGTRFHLASNVSSGPWGIVLQCGPNAGNTGQLYGSSVVYYKPFSVKYITPGVYDITVKVWRQNSTNLNCGWYRYKNYITVV